MHDTAIQNGRRFFATYMTHSESPVVLDIGAQNVNGSLKDLYPESASYIGIEFVSGPGVDVILQDPYKLPFASASWRR